VSTVFSSNVQIQQRHLANEDYSNTSRIINLKKNILATDKRFNDVSEAKKPMKISK